MTASRRVDVRVRFKEGNQWLIPEELILRRWRRKRTRPGTVFKGVRLPPGTWRAVLRCLSSAGRVDCASPAALRAALDRLPRTDSVGKRLRTPTLELLGMMVGYLAKRRVLEPLLQRHQFDVDSTSPGIPDLFLCRVEADGRVTGARFVEVKRWDEEMLPSQIRELRFLRSLGLKAGVVRLLKPPREGEVAVA